jgi:cytochrome P450
MRSLALTTPAAGKLPAGPSSKLWETVRYLYDPVGTILSLGRKYGDLFTYPTFVRPLVVAGAPELIRAIFAADPDIFAPFSVEMSAPVLGRGSVLLQHGAKHKRARKLLQPPFHGARMRAHAQIMQQVTLARLAQAPRGRRFPVEDLFRDISLDVIIRTIFGVGFAADGEDRGEAWRRAVLDSVAAFSPLIMMFTFLRRELGGFGPWAKFRRLLGAVHALLRGAIAARRDAPPGDDILGLLLAARDEEGAPMEEQEMVEQLYTMVIAGHETTATALAWAVDEVYRQPALLTRLRDELGSGDVDTLTRAPLLDAVCAETLRLHPLIPTVGRMLLKPFELGGYRLPEGVGVGACVSLAHCNETVYPEPHRFNPERFLGGASFSPYEYLPFGGGARRCIGAAFALYEMKIVLGTILLRAKLTPASRERARTGARAATVGPRGGVPITLA